MHLPRFEVKVAFLWDMWDTDTPTRLPLEQPKQPGSYRHTSPEDGVYSHSFYLAVMIFICFCSKKGVMISHIILSHLY